MPLYEFKCPECDKLVELQLSIKDNSSPFCPDCDGEVSMKKQISRSSFSLKGSGWARDGYSSKKR